MRLFIYNHITNNLILIYEKIFEFEIINLGNKML